MKKSVTAILAIMLIVSLLCFSSCGLISDFLDEWLGDESIKGGNGGGDSSDHTHQFEDYFTYSQCTVSGCKLIGRKKGQDTYANDFKYTLTSAKIAQIRAVYAEMETYLHDGGDYEQFVALYELYLDYLDYAGHQYQVASILNDVKYNTTTTNNYRTASSLYNEMYANYYKLYELIYNSEYKEDFYAGWDEDDIEQALYYAEIYGGSADVNDEVDAILAEYEQYMDSINWFPVQSKQLETLGEIYGRLVVANNAVAAASHYNNYMDYAYENEYNRDYTPEEVATTMRAYVKQYIAPIFIEVYMTYHALVQHGISFDSSVDRSFYYGLMYDSLFEGTSYSNFDRVRTTTDYISDYFKYMQMSALDTGGQKFDFHSAVEDLFKNGNYFTGDYEGAYTWWIDAIKSPILYFGDGYDTAFTFVHEFGHYYENIYNGSLHLSYDHNETHSQGNEMLFLAWLANNKPTGISNGFALVEVVQLFDMLSNIVMATAVDEFEQAAYTGSYNGQEITSYADLFAEILGTYKGTYNGTEYSAANILTARYWSYVVFSSSAYYISYAMSALPSIELYAMAMSDGLNSARDSYIKLFTFANGSRFVATRSDGSAYLRSSATYEAILNYCGLQGPFQEGLYTTLQAYFNSRTDL